VSEYVFYEVNATDKCFWRVAVTDVDTDGDGLNDHEENQYGSNPASADADDDNLSDMEEAALETDSNDADTDDDGADDGEDAVPVDAEINWPKTPENRYVWLSQVDEVDPVHHSHQPRAVNKHGQILFRDTRAYYGLTTITDPKNFWDSASSQWISLPLNGSQEVDVLQNLIDWHYTINGVPAILPAGQHIFNFNEPVYEFIDINDEGAVYGVSIGATDLYIDHLIPGMTWKRTGASLTQYAAPSYFYPQYPFPAAGGQSIVNRNHMGPTGGAIANDGTINSFALNHAAGYEWMTYNSAAYNSGTAASAGMQSIKNLNGNVDSSNTFPGAILDKDRALFVETLVVGPGASDCRLWLKEESTQTDLSFMTSGLIFLAEMSLAPNFRDDEQDRLWITTGASVYLEKRAGGSGISRWHNPPSMGEGAIRLNARGEAITGGKAATQSAAAIPPKLWRNGKYTDLKDVTSKPTSVTITQAIDLASNGIILAQATENGVTKTGLLLPLKFKKMWETPNKANQIVVQARRDDPTNPSQQADAQDNIYGAPRNMLYVAADPGDGKYHVSVDIAAGLRDQFVCAAYMLGNGNKISGSDTAFPAGDEPADMLIPSTTGSQSGEYYEIKVAFDINKNGLIDGSETPIRLVALDTAYGLPPAPVVRGFSQATVVAAKATVQGQVTGTGWTGWLPNWPGEWFVPNAIALERLFYDGGIGGMVPEYQPTEILTPEPLNAFGTQGDFNEWLTHHAGSSFNADGVTTVQHYKWNNQTRISSLIANSSPLSLLKNNGTITTQMASVTNSTVENFMQAGVPIGQSQIFPTGVSGYNLHPVLASLRAPHSSPAWVPEQTLLIGDKDGYAGVIPDDAFGTVGRSRFINGEYRFIVKKEERVEHTAYPDGSFTYTPYIAVVVYLRVSGRSQDLYDFNHNAGGINEPPAIIQLGYGNGSYGRTNGVIYRTTVDIFKDYEMKEIHLP
jgi:hypothetical protein